MKELNSIIAKNLIDLRKRRKWTQAELAEKLNYSDKAVSKWEKGDALPDIQTLYNLANIYEVTLNDLTSVAKIKDSKHIDRIDRNNKIIITSLSVLTVWIVATIVFIYAQITEGLNFWTLFIWAIPVSSIILLVFNGIWGKRKYAFIIISVLFWGLILSIYLQTLETSDKNIWPLFILGAPLQIATVLWSQLKRPHRKKDNNQ